jgi:hypothetical protein
MTEYRKITADDLPTDGTYAKIEEWSPARDSWIETEARVARLSDGSEVIHHRYASGGTSCGPKSHGIIARVAEIPAEQDASTVALTCGCRVPSPKLTPSQIFHSWGTVSTLVISCPQGHGLLEIAPVPVEPIPAGSDYIDPWADPATAAAWTR